MDLRDASASKNKWDRGHRCAAFTMIEDKPIFYEKQTPADGFTDLQPFVGGAFIANGRQ